MWMNLIELADYSLSVISKFVNGLKSFHIRLSICFTFVPLSVCFAFVKLAAANSYP